MMTIMGLLDHSRTWRFTIDAPPSDCASAFARAMAGRGAFGFKSKWRLDGGLGGSGTGTIRATYAGRAGVAAALTTLSGHATREADAAVGSELCFEVEAAGSPTVCALWLAASSTSFGFTADARFFRGYLNAIERQLRQLDPDLRVEKG